jgi:yecA family protein
MNKNTPPYQALMALCEIPEIKNNAKDGHQILGFICAISSTPVQLDVQDWLPCLWADGCIPSFSNEQLAVEFASASMQFYDACLSSYQQSTALLLPTEQWLNASLHITEQGRSFAFGYLSGFQSVAEIWQNITMEPEGAFEQVVQTTTLLLSKMANPAGDDPQMQAVFNQLPEMREIISSLPLLLSTLGHFSMQENHHD